MPWLAIPHLVRSLVYLAILGAVGIYAWQRRDLAGSGPFRRALGGLQTGVILVAVLVPVADSASAVGRGPSPLLREVAPSLLVAGFLFAGWGLFRRRPAGVIPLAHATLFETMSDAAIVLDDRGRVMDLNAAAQQAIGQAAAQVIGQPAVEIFSNWPGLVKQLRTPAETKTEVIVEGEEGQRHFEATSSPVNGKRGRQAGRLIVMRDVTEREQAADLLRDKSRRLEQAQEVLEAVTKGTEVAVAAQGMDFSYSFVNQAYREQIKRLTGKDVRIGSSMVDAYADMPEEQATAIKQWSRALHGESAEYRLESGEPGPNRRVYNVRHTPLYDAQGHVIGAGEVAFDITNQVRAEEELRRQREWLQVTLSSIGDGVIATDADARVTFLNPTAAALTGWQQEEALGQPIDSVFRIVDEKTGKPGADLVGRVLSEGHVVEMGNDTALITQDGRQIPIEDSAAPILDTSGSVAGVVLVFHDVTEKRRALESLRESEERLRRAEEIAHLGSWELDLANNRLTWSDEVYRIFGLAPQEFGATYEAFLQHVHPDDRAAVDAAYSGSLREDSDGYEIEHRVVRQGSGEIRIVHEKCEHVRDAEGKIVRSIGMVHDITERKRNEEQIANLARFPGESPNPILRLSRDGTILYANGSGRVFLEEWNKKVGEIAPPDWQQSLQEALQTESEKVQDIRCGERIYSVAAVPISEGGYVNLYGRDVTKARESQRALQQARDELELRVQERTQELLQTNKRLRKEIEERIRTEQSLRLEEARLDALLRLSQIGEVPLSEIAGFVLEQGVALTQSKIGFVGFLNEDESIYTLNAVSKEVVKECDVTGDPVQWHIAGAGIWADAIRERRTLFINDYGKPHPRKKGLPPGHPNVAKFMVVPILEGERVVAVAGVGNKAADYDSSDERQIALLLDGMWNCVQRNAAREALLSAHEELQASEERFRQLAENIHEVFWMLEPGTQRLLYVSPAYDAIWGRPAQELYERPRSFLDTVHADDVQQVLDGFTLEWQPYNGEFRILRPDGSTRWIRIRSFPIRNEQGEVYRLAGVATDLTEQKAAHSALIHAERLSIAGKMAASLAHEINNPLQSVIGCLGLARLALDDGRNPGEYLRIAHQEVQRAARTVSQLRSLGRPVQDGLREPTDLNSLLNDVLVLNQKRLQSHQVEVIWEPDADLPLLTLMPDPMRQVFLNLVINATDAMAGGGQLRVSTAPSESPAGVRVIVADTGRGIASEALPHIFEAFYTTRAEGLGMGLFISKRIVEQHRGRIEVESQPGAGTTFTVWLPSLQE
jgi:PAS domain S-box-containing protein